MSIAKRAALLKEELELVDKVKSVAEKRRKLPPGGQLKEDYVFHWANDGKVGKQRPQGGRRRPRLRHLAGAAEIGAAWRRTRKGSEDTYLSVKLDDPALPQPIWGALLEGTDSAPARLVWRRDRKDDG